MEFFSTILTRLDAQVNLSFPVTQFDYPCSHLLLFILKHLQILCQFVKVFLQFIPLLRQLLYLGSELGDRLLALELIKHLFLLNSLLAIDDLLHFFSQLISLLQEHRHLLALINCFLAVRIDECVQSVHLEFVVILNVFGV